MSQTDEPKQEPGICLLAGGRIRPMSELIDEIIEHTLEYYEGNISRTSRELEIGRSTLYRFLTEGTPTRKVHIQKAPKRTSK